MRLLLERTRRLLVFACGGTLLSTPATRAQRIQALEDRRCANCRISIERVAVLSDSNFEVTSEAPVSCDSRQHFLVIGEKGTAIGIYGPRGEFQSRIGGAGGAAGEFRSISRILIGPGDSLHVLDPAARRRTVFAPALRRAARTSDMPPVSDAMLMAGDQMLAAGRISTRESAGQPLHLIASDGTILKSFGNESQEMSARTNIRAFARSITAARGGGFWVGDYLDYTLERWSRSLQKVEALTRKVDWFPAIPADAVFRPPSVERPPTFLRRVWQDSSGLVWVNIGVAAEGWKATTPATSGESPAVPVDEINKVYDSIVEVIDPAAGVVIASRRIRGNAVPVLNCNFVEIVGEDSLGGLAISVFRLSLAR